MSDLYLVEIAAYDPTVPGAITLRYGTRGYTTGTAEVPANTFYDYRLKQPVNVTRDCFASGTTSGQSRVGYGDLVLLNADGELDALLAYGFDGRALTIRRATATDPAYPGDFTTVFVGTMEQATFGLDEITIRIRDRQYETAVPLQTTKYAGTNALPAGLEGVADDLLGKPKPVCLGSVLNVPAVCVNTSKLIYQVHDGAVASIPHVYDQGVALPNPSAPWTGIVMPGTHPMVMAFAYGAGMTVAVGYDGTTGCIWYSDDDGATWTPAVPDTFGATNKIPWDVCFGDGQFVALGGVLGGATGIVETSPDGINWTDQTNTLGAAASGICYDAALDLYVMVGLSGKMETSPDGAAWTTRTSSFGATTIRKVASDSAGTVVAVGDSGKAAYSTDGINWAQVACEFPATTPYGSATTCLDVMYGHGLWVVTATSRYFSTSTDGITWTLRDTGAHRGQSGGCYDGERFVFASCKNLSLYAYQGQIVTSYDGETWRSVGLGTSPLPDKLYDCYSNGTVYLAGGENGTHEIYTSPVAGLPYANIVDLEDDTLAPEPGLHRCYLAGGYFRLGSPPAGLVTADVTQGAAAANRTAAQLANVVLARAIAATSFNAADVAALDTANASVLGHWQGLEETTCNVVLDRITGSTGSWWGVDQTGDFRIKRLTAPAILHWTTVGGAGWTAAGTPTRTPAATTVSGIPLDLIGDDDGAGWEAYFQAIAFTGNGAKLVSIVLKEGTTPSASGTVIDLYDVTLTATRLFATVIWVAGAPSVVTATGTLLGSVSLGSGGYRLTWATGAVTAASNNTLYVSPASEAVAATGNVYAGDIRAYDYAPTAATTFTPSDVVAGSLQRLATLDEGNGLPVYKVTLRWGRNYAVQDTDLAGGATDARRGVVSKEWREAVYTDATVQTQYLLALATIEDSCFTTAANALTEATRRQVLRGERRDRYELTVALDAETAALDLGSIVTLQYDRYDLTGAGKQFVIVGVAPDAMARKIRFSLWS